MRQGCFDCTDEFVGLWKGLEVVWFGLGVQGKKIMGQCYANLELTKIQLMLSRPTNPPLN